MFEIFASGRLMARVEPTEGEHGGTTSHEGAGHPTTTAEHAEAGHHEDAHHGPSFWGLMFYIALTVAIIFGLLAQAKKGLRPAALKNRSFTSKLTLSFEQLYLFIENLTVGIIGAHGRKYIPMIVTMWLMVFFGSVIALFFPTSPTADLSFNLGMALIAVGYVQWEGMRSNGVLGHFKHFAGPKLPIALIPITLMIFVIELISEAMKNVSLTLRLYGNIDGGHRAAEAMNTIGKNLIPLGDAGLSIPFGAFLLPIKLLTCVVQALIFSLLFSVYLSLVTHHEDHSHDHAEDDHAHEFAAA